VSKYSDDFAKLCRKLAQKYDGVHPATLWWKRQKLIPAPAKVTVESAPAPAPAPAPPSFFGNQKPASGFSMPGFGNAPKLATFGDFGKDSDGSAGGSMLAVVVC
jgi:hypothetical protein